MLREIPDQLEAKVVLVPQEAKVILVLQEYVDKLEQQEPQVQQVHLEARELQDNRVQ